MNKPLKLEYHYNKDAKHTSLTTTVIIPLRELEIRRREVDGYREMVIGVEGVKLEPGWSIDNRPGYASGQLGIINEEGLFSSDLEPVDHTNRLFLHIHFKLPVAGDVFFELDDDDTRYGAFKVVCSPEWIHSLPRNSAISIVRRWTIYKLGATHG